MTYVGRFAPSPTGELHFGSLLAALASYLDARAHQGRWLLRIEDIDPPREQPGAKQRFPGILEQYGLHWDGEISWQSRRLAFYQDALDQLLAQNLAYPCECSRKQIQQRSDKPLYDRYCRYYPPAATMRCAVRVDAHSLAADSHFADRIQGTQRLPSAALDDFVVLRKDGLFAYQLAVVVDDYLQGITHVVRGSDLLEETHKQRSLQRLLRYPSLHYAHIPVAANGEGQKLSKQTFARPLTATRPVSQLLAALTFLGQQPDPALADARCDELLRWAVEHWRIEAVPRTLQQSWAD